MKLQPDRIETQSVTAYGPGWVAIQGEKITHSVLITSEGVRLDWNCASFDDLGPQHFAKCCGPKSSKLAQFQSKRTPSEVMSTLCVIFSPWMATHPGP